MALYPIFFQNGSATDAFVSTIENRIIVTDRRSTIPQVVSITVTDENRPGLTVDLTGTELLRWYWLKEELTDFARRLDIRATGDKELLVQRIAARLDGVPFAEPQLAKRATRAQLGGPLTSATVIPKGQRCSQVIRAWFIEQVGASFGFDAEMRAFFVHTDGTQTMQDALDRYRATREQGPKPIDAQFEYNRFTRAWHEANPAGPREDLLHAWQRYRERPVDQRGMLSLQLSPSPARRYASAESMGSTLGA